MSAEDARIAPERAARILDALPDMVFVLDDVGRVVEANERCRSLLGWTEDDLGRHALDFVHPDDVDVVATSMISIQGKAVGTPIELRVVGSDGTWRWIELIGADMGTTDGDHGVVCVGRDITQRRMWEVAGGDLARFQQVVQHAASITMLLDGSGTITSVNNAFSRLLGHGQSVVVGQPLVTFAVPASASTLGAALDRCIASSEGQSIEVAMRTAGGVVDGRPLQLEIRNLSTDPVLDGLIVTGHDVSDLRSARHKLEFLAGHDALTGLANRSLLPTHMTAMVATGDPMAILFLDLDHFKPINDVLGHEAGDELLECVSRRLELSTRPGDIVARVGGDEFVVIAPASSPRTSPTRWCNASRTPSASHSSCAVDPPVSGPAPASCCPTPCRRSRVSWPGLTWRCTRPRRPGAAVPCGPRRPVDHPEDLAVVAAVVGLGTALGLWVVAEAVETDTQLRMLREMGCSHAQGNIISPALPPAAFIDWLARRLSAQSRDIHASRP